MIEKIKLIYISSDKKPTMAHVAGKLNTTVEEVKSLLTEYNTKEFEEIQKIRSLHNSVRNRSEPKGTYDFKGFKDFYNWYKNTPKKCCYCGTSEKRLIKIYDKNKWKTKRGRGRTLEVERVNAKSNIYNSDNCMLACYYCNNHKSDVITQDDFDEFFAKPMKSFLKKLSKVPNPNPSQT